MKPSEISGDVHVVTDPDHDHIAAGATEVRSDTGELARNWSEGVQTIDTPRTQAVNGWIGGKTLALKDASFQFRTRKAVVALTSIDDKPLSASRFILITAVGQARPSQGEHLPFLSEPVVGTIILHTRTEGIELLSLGPDGKVVSRTTPALRTGRPGDSPSRGPRHTLVRAQSPRAGRARGRSGNRSLRISCRHSAESGASAEPREPPKPAWRSLPFRRGAYPM